MLRIAVRPHPISLSLLTRFYYYECAPFASSRLAFKIRNPSIFLFLLLNSFLCASSFYLHSFFISSISPSGLSTPYNSTLLVSPLLRTASAFTWHFELRVFSGNDGKHFEKRLCLVFTKMHFNLQWKLRITGK